MHNFSAQRILRLLTFPVCFSSCGSFCRQYLWRTEALQLSFCIKMSKLESWRVITFHVCMLRTLAPANSTSFPQGRKREHPGNEFAAGSNQSRRGWYLLSQSDATLKKIVIWHSDFSGLGLCVCFFLGYLPIYRLPLPLCQFINSVTELVCFINAVASDFLSSSFPILSLTHIIIIIIITLATFYILLIEFSTHERK